MRSMSLIALVAIYNPVTAQNPPGKITTIPAPSPVEWQDVIIPAGQKLARLTTGDKVGKWILVDSITAELVVQDSGKVAVMTAPPGKYKVIVCCDSSDPVCMNVIFGVAAPIPPPIPVPVPTPPVVVPVDPLAVKFQTLYTVDTSATKTLTLAALSELFTKAQTVAADPTVLTVGDMAKRIHDDSSIILAGSLTELRKAISAEIALAFPADSVLTADSRIKAKALFVRIVTSLQGCK